MSRRARGPEPGRCGPLAGLRDVRDRGALVAAEPAAQAGIHAPAAVTADLERLLEVPGQPPVRAGPARAARAARRGPRRRRLAACRRRRRRLARRAAARGPGLSPRDRGDSSRTTAATSARSSGTGASTSTKPLAHLPSARYSGDRRSAPGGPGARAREAHPRAGHADQHVGVGDEGRPYAAGGRVTRDRDMRDARPPRSRDGRGHRLHLQQGAGSLLHPGSARGRDARRPGGAPPSPPRRPGRSWRPRRFPSSRPGTRIRSRPARRPRRRRSPSPVVTACRAPVAFLARRSWSG